MIPMGCAGNRVSVACQDTHQGLTVILRPDDRMPSTQPYSVQALVAGMRILDLHAVLRGHKICALKRFSRRFPGQPIRSCRPAVTVSLTHTLDVRAVRY